MASKLLELILSAQDLTSEEVNRVNAALDESQAKAQGAQRALEDLEAKGSKALIGLGAAGSALIGTTTLLTARVDTLGVVTAQLGHNMDLTEKQVRDTEKAVEDQGITTRKARESLALMAEANIDWSHAAEIAREAQDAAVIAGTNSSDAFRNLTYAISSGNIRIARTMGLQVNFNRAYEERARVLGVVKAELTEEQRVEARTQEVLKAGVAIQGTYTAAMESAGKQLTSLPRHIEQAGLALGKDYQPALKAAIGVTTSFFESIEHADASTQTFISRAVLGGSTFATFGGIALAVIPKIQSTVAALTALDAAQKAVAVSNAAMAGGIGIIAALLAVTINEAIKQNEASKAQARSVDEVAQAMAQGGKSYERFRNEAAAALDPALLNKRARLIQHNSHGMVTYSEAVELAKDHLIGYTRAEYDAFVQQEQLRIGAEDADQVMLNYRATVEKAVQPTKDWGAAMRGAGDDAADAAPKIGSFFGSISPGIGSTIEQELAQINWAQAGGNIVEGLHRQVITATDQGLITPDEAETMLSGLYAQTQRVAVQAGETTAYEAARNIADNLGVPYANARQYVDDLQAEIEGLPSATEVQIRLNRAGQEGGDDPVAAISQAKSDLAYMASHPYKVTVDVTYVTHGTPPAGTPGGAHGLSMKVPGFQFGGSFGIAGSNPGPGDSKLVQFMGRPGERVDVTPPSVNNSRSITIAGPVNISNGMDQRGFEDMLKRALQ